MNSSRENLSGMHRLQFLGHLSSLWLIHDFGFIGVSIPPIENKFAATGR